MLFAPFMVIYVWSGLQEGAEYQLDVAPVVKNMCSRKEELSPEDDVYIICAPLRPGGVCGQIVIIETYKMERLPIHLRT
jgi:hypothetical protein